MYNKKIYLCLILILTSLLLPGCKQRNCEPNCPEQTCLPMASQGPTTVFVHGTLPALLNLWVRAFDLPLGLTPALVQGDRFVHGRIAFILNDYACNRALFPLESFYFYGWPGKLNFDHRIQVAEELYDCIKNLPRPLTVMGHSHGGNVALNLARIAQERGDTSFVVDRLILLACPVQEATLCYASSPIFKRVISVYSTGDSTQILDPQGLYRKVKKSFYYKKVPVLSGRCFPAAPNLYQARVLIDRRNIVHMEFIYKRFLSRLPAIIDLLENNCPGDYIINLPRDKFCPPELVAKQ